MTLRQDRDADRGRTRHDGAESAGANSSRMIRCGIAVQRIGAQGWLQVTGELSGITRRHLDDLLDWLISDGVTQITVSLLTAEQLDRASLVVLQVAHAELRSHGGQLLVIAPRAAARAAVAAITPQPKRDSPHGVSRRRAGQRVQALPV